LIDALLLGRKILLCGNGGSAADAQHIAAELTGRYEETNRRALPALALTTDTSSVTAISNDLSYEQSFALQLARYAVREDLLITISSSGNSPNWSGRWWAGDCLKSMSFSDRLPACHIDSFYRRWPD
jgi:D-sedoheptulose 7-phosphate isomerase